NLVGEVRNLAVLPMRHGRFATFQLARPARQPVPCIAFGEKAEQLVAHACDGIIARLFGYWETHTVRRRDIERTIRRFRVLWSAEPKAAELVKAGYAELAPWEDDGMDGIAAVRTRLGLGFSTTHSRAAA